MALVLKYFDIFRPCTFKWTGDCQQITFTVSRRNKAYCILVCLSLYFFLISGHIRTGTDLWQCTLMVTLNSAAPLWDQTENTITWYPTQSNYPETHPNSPCPILVVPSTWLGSDTYQFDKTLVWLDLEFEPTISHTRDPCSTDSATMPCRLCYGQVEQG